MKILLEGVECRGLLCERVRDLLVREMPMQREIDGRALVHLTRSLSNIVGELLSLNAKPFAELERQGGGEWARLSLGLLDEADRELLRVGVRLRVPLNEDPNALRSELFYLREKLRSKCIKATGRFLKHLLFSAESPAALKTGYLLSFTECKAPRGVQVIKWEARVLPPYCSNPRDIALGSGTLYEVMEGWSDSDDVMLWICNSPNEALRSFRLEIERDYLEILDDLSRFLSALALIEAHRRGDPPFFLLARDEAEVGAVLSLSHLESIVIDLLEVLKILREGGRVLVVEVVSSGDRPAFIALTRYPTGAREEALERRRVANRCLA